MFFSPIDKASWDNIVIEFGHQSITTEQDCSFAATFRPIKRLSACLTAPCHLVAAQKCQLSELERLNEKSINQFLCKNVSKAPAPMHGAKHATWGSWKTTWALSLLPLGCIPTAAFGRGSIFLAIIISMFTLRLFALTPALSLVLALFLIGFINCLFLLVLLALGFFVVVLLGFLKVFFLAPGMWDCHAWQDVKWGHPNL